jgi:hypothetical protein
VLGATFVFRSRAGGRESGERLPSVFGSLNSARPR